MRTEVQKVTSNRRTKKPTTKSVEALVARVPRKDMLEMTLNVGGHSTYCSGQCGCGWGCDYVSS